MKNPQVIQVRDTRHGLLADVKPGDASRQKAVVSLRRLLSSKVRSQNNKFFERGSSLFKKKYGKDPVSIEEIEEVLFSIPNYRSWSAANRAVQEMLWISVGEPIFRDYERIKSESNRLIKSDEKLGSLHLKDDFEMLEDIASVDIHLQPGGYMLERDADDIVAGALYETGGNIFSFSVGGQKHDSKSEAVSRLIEENYPAFKPSKILDIGCSAGSASSAYAQRYPEAEVHAIDLGRGMLRYAHARAESLGVSVHFHQMDARKLDFEDSSFDLVVSHNALHEMSAETRVEMIKESLRVLRSGGVLVYQDVNAKSIVDPLIKADVIWEKHFNGEKFWVDYISAKLKDELITAGFCESNVKEFEIPAIAGALKWYVISARK
jgi:ubiquinone/menaquinone biosynthesis C-methylase UbiE